MDECTGPAAARWLERAGHDVMSVYEESPGAGDSEVIDLALRENRILVTNDKGFGEKVFREGRRHSGVLLLRLEDERPQSKIDALERVLHAYGDELDGHFVVVTERSIRISTPTEAWESDAGRSQ